MAWNQEPEKIQRTSVERPFPNGLGLEAGPIGLVGHSLCGETHSVLTVSNCTGSTEKGPMLEQACFPVFSPFRNAAGLLTIVGKSAAINPIGSMPT
jgi:hypothetical protein